MVTRQCSQEALQKGQYLEALSLRREMRMCIDMLFNLPPETAGRMWPIYGTLVNDLLARIYEIVNSNSTCPPPPLPRALICWETHLMLLEHEQLPVEPPDWLLILESHLTQDGALFWFNLIGEDADAPHRALKLYERLAYLINPCPEWVALKCDELKQQQPVAECNQEPDSNLDSVPHTSIEPKCFVWEGDAKLNPAAIKENITQWLSKNKSAQKGIQIGMTYRPGAAIVNPDSDVLELNLAPLIQSVDLALLENCLESFFEPLKKLTSIGQIEVLEPSLSMICSLEALWREGEELNLDQFRAITYAVATWNRLSGPGCLGAKLLPTNLPSVDIEQFSLILELDTIELALLQSVQFDSIQLVIALEQLRQEKSRDLTLKERNNQWWFRPVEALENLRRFQQELDFNEGFASTQDIRCWGDGALACLTEAIQLKQTALCTNDLSSTWFYLTIAQTIRSGRDSFSQLYQSIDFRDLYPLIAGKEVLYLGPDSDEVEQHHRSGSSFRLFKDIEIKSYSLRCLSTPKQSTSKDSRSSFKKNLESCLEEVQQLHHQRAFTLVLVAAGAYRLPLCQELRRRYDIQCIGFGKNLRQLFGVERHGDPRWRFKERNFDLWIKIEGFDPEVP